MHRLNPSYYYRYQLVLFVFLLISITATHAIQISDQERREGFAARNYSWPIEKMVPPTEGWDRLMRRRIRQVEALESTRTGKIDQWASVLGQALVLPNFTQFGWAVAKAPEELTAELQQAVHSRMHDHEKTWEEDDIAIVGDFKPLMVEMLPGLIDKALTRLHPYHEAWTGIPLKKQKGYGLRIYKNNSQLYMHLDKMETHIISCIFHIDHSDDAQPWPLVIEDFEGITQHVHLNKGDMLLYESAKCLHGRPIPFEGSWYTSLFLHYSPQDWPFEGRSWEPQYAMPDHWEEVRPYSDSDQEQFGESLPHLIAVDTAMYEQGCPNKWCGVQDKASWNGVAKTNVAVTSHGIEEVLSIVEKASNSEETTVRDDEL
ncbi:expressed unknown protein [Seminavis robusta]|uniref:Uncharacterized protein n=1 Tax=Seminavis robusta TaxID=568900 RepID=A0A9N8EAZ3_9STRA|nr:expressed unknown protein [Seminavis robusta]|eukprot:Sro744_g196210.1 n/a (373) ;mRNA; f:34083-35201